MPTDPVLLLQELVRIPTYESETDAVELLKDKFTPFDVDVSSREVAEGRFSFLASWGRGERCLVLNSHLDTVSPGDVHEWTHPPFDAAIVDGRLYGRGACDAKGCLAPMISAFADTVRTGDPSAGRLILQAVAMEETAGAGTAAEIADGLRAEAAVVGEPTDLDVCICHKGVMRLDIATRGRAAHASDPWDAVNAIVKMQPVIEALERLAERISLRSNSLLGRPSLAVTLIKGGIGRNVIPPHCEISIDRRFLPEESVDEVRKEIDEAIDEAKSRDTDIEASVTGDYFAEAAYTDPSEAIVKLALEARSRFFTTPSEPKGFPACADMRLLTNDAGIPTILLGPGSLKLAHKVDEYIPVNEVRTAKDLYASLISQWLQGV